jgi:hypothetical protein
MPNGPSFARFPRTKSRTIYTNDALYSRAINELRRPAPIPRYCAHGHGSALQCSLCIRAYEYEHGMTAPRM